MWLGSRLRQFYSSVWYFYFLWIIYSSIYVGGKDLPKFSKITKLRHFYNDQVKPNCSCLILSIIIPNYELYKNISEPCLFFFYVVFHHYYFGCEVSKWGSTSTSSNPAHCHSVRLEWCHYHHQDGQSASIRCFCQAVWAKFKIKIQEAND